MRRIHKRSQAPPALLAYRKMADPDHADDVERRLNLNATELRLARAQAIDNLRRELSRRFGSSSWRRQDLERYLESLRRQRPFPEFLAIYEYWLEKKLTQR